MSWREAVYSRERLANYEVHAGSSRLQARESEGESQVESCPKVKLPPREIHSSRQMILGPFHHLFFFDHG